MRISKTSRMTLDKAKTHRLYFKAHWYRYFPMACIHTFMTYLGTVVQNTGKGMCMCSYCFHQCKCLHLNRDCWNIHQTLQYRKINTLNVLKTVTRRENCQIDFKFLQGYLKIRVVCLPSQAFPLWV